MSARLLPYAVSEEEYASHVAERKRRIRTTLPIPTRLEVVGATPADAALVRTELGQKRRAADRYHRAQGRDPARHGHRPVRDRPLQPRPIGRRDRARHHGEAEELRAAVPVGVARPQQPGRPDAGGSGERPPHGVQLAGAPVRVADGLHRGQPVPGGRGVLRAPRPDAALRRAARGGRRAHPERLRRRRTDSRVPGSGSSAAEWTSASRSAASRRSGSARTSSTTVGAARIGDPGLPDVDGTERRASLKVEVNGQDGPIVPGRGIALTATLLYHFEHRGCRRRAARNSAAAIDLPGRFWQGEVTASIFHRVRGRTGCSPTWGRHVVRQHAAPEQVLARRPAAAQRVPRRSNSAGRTICTARPAI